MKDNYSVRRIKKDIGRPFIVKHHYSKGCHANPSPIYGLFEDETLIGVLMIANPCSENVKKSIFGLELKDKVRELHRLAIIDDTPKNTESWFISRVLKKLREDRPDLWGIVSFADTTIKHNGTIYQATNAIFYGKSAKSTFYLDGDRLRHPRQNGVNISQKVAKSRGWIPVKREAKNRYLYILGDKRQRKERKKLIIIEPQSYPSKSKGLL
jgi:hypothetical protein